MLQQHSKDYRSLLNPRLGPLEGPLLARFSERNLSQLRSGESDSSGTLFHSPSAQESAASRLAGSMPSKTSIKHQIILCKRKIWQQI